MNTKTNVVIALVVVAVALGFFGGTLWNKSKQIAEVPAESVAVNQQKAESNQPAATSNQEKVVDETANWQTYTNAKYGFEVKYPSDWYAKSGSGETLTKIENKQKDVYLGVDAPSEGLANYGLGYSIQIKAAPYATQEKFLETQKSSFGSTVIKLEQIQLGANNFYKRVANLPGPAGVETYYVYSDGTGYEFTIYKSTANTDLALESAKSVFSKIISTLKFTDVAGDETANWQTYRNEKYGFEFKYPNFFSVKPPFERNENEEVLNVLEGNDYGSIVVYIKNEKLNPDNIQGLYGRIERKNLEIIDVNGLSVYVYKDGDAGCGADIANIPAKDKTLIVSFGACEGERGSVGFKKQILSTFRFVK